MVVVGASLIALILCLNRPVATDTFSAPCGLVASTDAHIDLEARVGDHVDLRDARSTALDMLRCAAGRTNIPYSLAETVTVTVNEAPHDTTVFKGTFNRHILDRAAEDNIDADTLPYVGVDIEQIDVAPDASG